MIDYPAFVIPTATTWCVVPGCQRKMDDAERILHAVFGEDVLEPRIVVPHTDLCMYHHRLFPKLLQTIMSEWPLLTRSVLRTASREERERVQTSNVGDVGAMWNPMAAEAIAEIKDWTAYLVRTILRERPVPEGHSHGLTRDTETRLALAAIARHHAYWLSSYPTMGPSWYGDALELRQLMTRSLQVSPSRRITINARCNEIVEETDYGPIYCDGQLYGILRNEGPKPTQILCSLNPTHVITKPAAGWMELLP